MIYSLSGKLIAKKSNFAVVETGGIGFKVSICLRTLRQLPKAGSKIKLLTYLHVSQNGAEIYGFLTEKELEFFELLITINGIGPKAAMKILEVMKIENLMAAVKQGRSDLLVKAAGIGSKKAARIILELSGKIKQEKSGDIEEMESNLKVEKVLRSLGYKQNEIQEAVKQISPKAKTLEEKVRSSLRIIAGK